MKKIIALTLMLILAFSFAAFSAEEITVTIDGKKVEFTDVKPIKKGETVFIPLRAVFEAAGAEVYWEGETQTIISSLGDYKAILQIGNPVLFLNDGISYSSHPDLPFIENNRTFVPTNAFSRAFDYVCQEDGNTIAYTK